VLAMRFTIADPKRMCAVMVTTTMTMPTHRAGRATQQTSFEERKWTETFGTKNPFSLPRHEYAVRVCVRFASCVLTCAFPIIKVAGLCWEDLPLRDDADDAPPPVMHRYRQRVHA
jgi:hypothetical protein